MSIDNLKVISAVWYPGDLGVIFAADTIAKKVNVYIGQGSGDNERADTIRILRLGTKYSLDQFKNYWLDALNLAEEFERNLKSK